MSSNSETVMFTVPRSTYYLAMIRRVTSDLARRVGFVDEDLNKIEMAIDEACSNAILYQSCIPDEALDLCVDLTPERLAVTLSDRGVAFAFDELGVFDIENHNQTASPGGLGIYIIKNFMDEVSYRHCEGKGNVLTMVKFRQPAAVTSN